MSHREILQRMARMLVRDLARQDQLEASDTALKACAAEISHDFEELVFLRNLARNMEIRDDSPDGWPVAQQVLPFLQRLIDAEVMILVAAGQPQQAGGAPLVQVGAPAVWIGPNTINQDTCRRLVETYAATAVHHPVVKNHFDKTWDG